MEENINTEPQIYEEINVQNGKGFSKKKIVSFIIGLTVIISFVFVFFIFILPQFKSKKPKDVTLTYWGVWEDSSAFQEIAQEFTKVHPNIKIRYEKQDIKSLGKYIDRLTTRMENGTGPDVFRYHNSWVTQLKPFLLPLPNEVIKAVELDKFYPVVEKDVKLSGAYYGVPIHFDTLGLFINTKIFSAAGITSYPSTWDDLTSSARKMTVKDSDGKIITSGVALGTFDNIAHNSDIISLLLIQNGADLSDINGKTKQNALDALDFYISFAKGDARVWNDTLENSKLAFAKGSLAMYFGYSWDIFELKAFNPSLEFVVIPVPHLPSRNATIASYWVEGVSGKTKFPQESFEFLKFLGSKEAMEKLYTKESKTRMFGELYPRADMASMLKTNPQIAPFIEQGEFAESTIFSSDTHDDAMVDALNAYLGNAVNSMINDNTSAQTAVETLSLGVNQIMSRYAGR